MLVRALIYDWDGVLFDSMVEEYKGCLAVFAAGGKEPPSLEYYCRYLTMPAYDWYVARGITKFSRETMFRIYRDAIDLSRVGLVNGALHGLERLKEAGIPIGIVSSRPWPALRGQVERFDVFRFLSFCIGGAEDKTIALKNCPLGFDSSEVAYVGDLISDVRDGKEVGLKTIAFLGSHGLASVFDQIAPDYIVSTHHELAQLVLGYPAPISLPGQSQSLD